MNVNWLNVPIGHSTRTSYCLMASSTPANGTYKQPCDGWTLPTTKLLLMCPRAIYNNSFIALSPEETAPSGTWPFSLATHSNAEPQRTWNCFRNKKRKYTSRLVDSWRKNQRNAPRIYLLVSLHRHTRRRRPFCLESRWLAINRRRGRFGRRRFRHRPYRNRPRLGASTGSMHLLRPWESTNNLYGKINAKWLQLCRRWKFFRLILKRQIRAPPCSTLPFIAFYSFRTICIYISRNKRKFFYFRHEVSYQTVHNIEYIITIFIFIHFDQKYISNALRREKILFCSAPRNCSLCYSRPIRTGYAEQVSAHSDVFKMNDSFRAAFKSHKLLFDCVGWIVADTAAESHLQMK